MTWKRQLHLQMCSGLLLLGFKGHPRRCNHFWKQSISSPAAIQTSINGSNWVKQTGHMTNTAKPFESHHPSKPFVCWKWSNCANSMCCPFHKVSKIKDTGGEIRYLPKPTFNSVKLHPALDLVLPSPIPSELTQNRVKLSNTTRKMIVGSLCPWWATGDLIHCHTDYMGWNDGATTAFHTVRNTSLKSVCHHTLEKKTAISLWYTDAVLARWSIP